MTHFWMKLHFAYLDNPRLGALPEDIQLRFYKLQMLAGKSNQEGVIKNSDEEIAWSLHITLDELKRTYAMLEPTGLFLNNGRGPEITRYIQEQLTPADPTGAERQERYREKHLSNNADGNTVTDCVSNEQSQSQSQSQELKSESESEDSQSSGVSTDQTDDNISLTKSQLLSLCGIPVKFRQPIMDNNQISKAVILAELARNYARKGPGKGQVKQPGFITGANLSHNELPDDEWFNQDRWISHLPSAMRTKLVLAHSEIQDQDDNNDKSSGYTQGENEPSKVSTDVPDDLRKAWGASMAQLKVDMPKASFDTFVKGAQISGVDGNIVYVKAHNDYAKEWLESRMTASLKRLLEELAGRPRIIIRFVTAGGA